MEVTPTKLCLKYIDWYVHVCVYAHTDVLSLKHIDKYRKRDVYINIYKSTHFLGYYPCSQSDLFSYIFYC